MNAIKTLLRTNIRFWGKCLVVLTALLFNLPVSGQQLQVQISQIDALQFPNIATYLTVRDTDGLTVGGLTEDNFEAYEDGTRELPITVVEITDDAEGVNVVLVIDRSTSMLGERMEDAIAAAQHFVSLMGARDSAAVVSFANTPRLDIGFTADRTALHNAIGQIFAQGGTAVYDALIRAADEADKISGRRAIILLTDGEDRHSWNTLDTAIARAVEVGVPVFTIGLDVGSDEKDELGRIADETGGVFYDSPDSDDLAAIYQMISELLHHSYIVYYNTHNAARDGTIRHVDMIANYLTSTGSDTGSYRAPLDVTPFVLTTNDVPVPGREFKLDIIVPDGGDPIYGMSRLVFRIGYDQQFMTLAGDAGKIVAGSVWGSSDSYTFSYTPNQAQGYIDLVIEKKAGQQPITGTGDIGFITFLIDSLAPDRQTLNFTFDSLSAYKENGIQLVTDTFDLSVNVFGNTIVALAANEKPSPSKTFTLQVHIPDHSRELPHTRNLKFSLNYDPNYFSFPVPADVAFQAGGMLGKEGEYSMVPLLKASDGRIEFEMSKLAAYTMMVGRGNFVNVTFDVLATLPDCTALAFTIEDLSGTDDTNWDIPLIPENLMMNSYGLIVWPGDTNNNGTVELSDVNFLGVSWGVNGPGRLDEPDVLAWKAQLSGRYDIYNAAFADADGSSQIDERDLIPIAINWKKSRNMQHQAMNKMVGSRVSVEPVGNIELSIREDSAAENAYRLYIRLVSQNPESVRGFTFKVRHGASDVNLLRAQAGNMWEEDPLIFSYFSADPEEISACLMLKPTAADNVEDGILAEVLFISSQQPQVDVFAFDRVGLISANGNVFEKNVDVASPVQKEQEIPDDFAVSAAYPNPFNPETQVRYTMPAAGDVVFTIVNTNGQIVRRHAESIAQAGAFHWLWNGRDTAGNAVASGVYFWQISARTVDGKQYFRNQKVTLMK